MTAARANVALGLELVRALREGEGCLPEADTDLNAASRAVVHAMLNERGGEVWLGNVNLRPDVSPDWIWRHRDGDPLYTFGADFVLPTHDAELDRMLRAHAAAPWNAKEAAKRVGAIFDRVRALGGYTLVWS